MDPEDNDEESTGGREVRRALELIEAATTLPSQTTLQGAQDAAREAYEAYLERPDDFSRLRAESAIHELARAEHQYVNTCAAEGRFVRVRTLPVLKAKVWDGKMTLDPALAHQQDEAMEKRKIATVSEHRARAAFHEHEAAVVCDPVAVPALRAKAEACLYDWRQAQVLANKAELHLYAWHVPQPCTMEALKADVWGRTDLQEDARDSRLPLISSI